MDIPPETNRFAEILTHPAVLGGGGAAISLRALPGATKLARFSNWAAGTMIAVVSGPAATEYMGITSARISALIIFTTGIIGLVLFDSVLTGLKKIDFVQLALDRFPFGKKGDK
jgi:hypothetical protein